MDVKPIHIDFIHLIAKGVQQEDAYRTTIGNKNTTGNSARSQASKLCKRYALEIQSEREKSSKLIVAAKDSEVVKNALNEVLTQAEVDAKLCKIIKGELIEVTQLNAFGKAIKAKITPSISSQLSAIETYNKRFGSNAPIKTDVTSKGNEITPPNIILNGFQAIK